MLKFIVKAMLQVSGAWLLAVSSPAMAEWWKAETNHFVLYSDSDAEDAREFAQHLERFDSALRTLQKMPADVDPGAANKIRVYRFGSQTDIAQLHGGGSSRVAGFYIPRAGSPVAFVPAKRNRRTRGSNSNAYELDEINVLQHEYTHHFMLQNFPATYPSWYVEGFAELNGTVNLYDDGSFSVGHPPESRGYALLKMEPYPLKRLLDTKDKMTSRDRLALYSTGWLLTHYLNFDDERRKQLNAYLTARGNGEDSVAAAERIFGDLDDLEKRLAKYKWTNLPAYTVTPANYSPPQVEMRKLTPGEEDIIREHMRSTRGVSKSQAKSVAKSLEGKSDQYPNNLFVQLTVAEAEFDAKDLNAAEIAASRALKIDPNSVNARLYQGMIAMERAKDNPQQYETARTIFADAAALDRKDPRPMILYYESYRKAGEPIPEQAIMALEQAFDYAAYDGSYRMLLGRQLLNEGKGALARSVLAPAAFAGDRSNIKLIEIVSLIDESKLDAANDKMNELFDKAERKANGEDVDD